MFPAAWENVRILKEDIVIKGYRIPPNVSQSTKWIFIQDIAVVDNEISLYLPSYREDSIFPQLVDQKEQKN